MEYQTLFEKRGDQYGNACLSFPHVRTVERQHLIDLLDIQNQQIILDHPAGTGYLSQGIHEQYPSVTKLLCAEKVPAFYKHIPPHFEHCNFGFDLFDLANESIHRVGSLAGLHHLKNKQVFFSEAYRVLKYEGIVAAADVKTNTRTAEFLNGFVDEYSETGHDGMFFAENDFSHYLKNAGFKEVSENFKTFTWNYPDWETMITHCKMLFALIKANDQQIADALQSHFDIHQSDKGVHLPWSLTYARGVK